MRQTKGFIVLAVLFVPVLITGAIGLSCGAKSAEVPASPPVPSTSSQIPEATTPSLPESPTEPAIPAGFYTYTDELKLFSISYPLDWQTAPSSVAEVEKSTKEAINNLKTGVPVDQTSIIFLAGLPNAIGGYEPSVIIIVEPIPAGVTTHDQLVESEVLGATRVFPDYKENSRDKTTVDGREATILDWEGTMTGQPKRRLLQMLTIAHKTVWVASCSATFSDFAKWQNDFDTIVRSLRISK
jgi:hypothetical protein